jgi:nitric oxide reductase NorE protein
MDMNLFALFFGVFMVTRGSKHSVFEHGRESLTLGIGTLNTLFLLTASLFVVLAVRAARRGDRERAPRLIVLAGLCGLGFIIDKGIEWSTLLSNGHNPTSNDFYTFFFALTGIHLLHLILGMGALTFMYRCVRKPVPGKREMRNLEVCASFWHLVDLLWIVLFALLYVLR